MIRIKISRLPFFLFSPFISRSNHVADKTSNFMLSESFQTIGLDMQTVAYASSLQNFTSQYKEQWATTEKIDKDMTEGKYK